MIHLNGIPAFGFETPICNANKYRKRAGVGPRMGDIDVNNKLKRFGYIPLFGSLVGFMRIRAATMGPLSLMPNKFSHVIRGTIEFFSLGSLLFIPDLLLTAYRNKKAKAGKNEFNTLATNLVNNLYA